jgi:hypothetical protein
MDDFMSVVIPTSQEQLDHMATVVMTGIHNVFPSNITNKDDPISERKLLKGKGTLHSQQYNYSCWPDNRIGL